MPTVLRVPDPYPTISDALAAANSGDTLLLAPGSYGIVTINKPVHLKGDTTDVTGNPVLFGGYDVSSGTPSALTYDFSYNPSVPTLFCEGLTVKSFSGKPYTKSIEIASGAQSTRITFNRCVIENLNGSFGEHGYPCYAIGKCLVNFVNCTRLTRDSDYYNGVIGVTDLSSEVRFVTCHWQKEAPYVKSSISGENIQGQIAVWLDDSVRTAQTGYGVDYGAWYAEQFMGVPYKITGPADSVKWPAALTNEDVQLSLFRSNLDGNGIENFAWETKNPNADGSYEFKYLSTDRKYAVVVASQEACQVQARGFYDPQLSV